VLAARQYDPSDGDHIHLGDCIANDREGILSNLAVDPPAHHLAKMIADPSLVSALTYHLERTSYARITMVFSVAQPTQPLLGELEFAQPICRGVRFHYLRHSHATQLLASGVHLKIASERLG
jgi:hypothetical protein